MTAAARPRDQGCVLPANADDRKKMLIAVDAPAIRRSAIGDATAPDNISALLADRRNPGNREENAVA
jgi:hypothetical protein